MRSPNNEAVTANDGEWRKHRDKNFKRVTSKLRRKNGRNTVREQLKAWGLI